jgi:hypothetical protein
LTVFRLTTTTAVSLSGGISTRSKIILSHELPFLATLCPVFRNGWYALSHSD